MSSIPNILLRKENAPTRQTQNPVRKLAAAAVDAALDKKGLDVLVMDMDGVSGVADMFVVCTGESELQVKAIADEVVESIREKYGEKPWHREGLEHKQWILLDYVDLVVHVFNRELRDFYSLERLWGDAPQEGIGDEGTSADIKLLHPEGA
ncbi:MAG: ribosome-associated protein [Rhodothermales bacterium]|jgi:ribosome-associated protein